MSNVTISDAIRYIGCDDHKIDLFESQYPLPNGASYNSYLILDEKVAVMDTADRRVSEEWFANLERELGGRTPDYLVVSHLEPDHAYNIQRLCEKYPAMQVVASVKTFQMLPQFFTMDFSPRKIAVKEGDTLSLGSHTLTFVMAPMVHWPEVMVEYESTEKVLFAADGFGKFGALDVEEEDWACEARRYYFNIVGRYGPSVQALLKKAAKLDIQIICPLHGPILKENLGYYIEKYDIWSSYRPEDEGVTLAYASIHGNTAIAAKKLAEMLEAKGQKVSMFDLARDSMSEAVEDAFRYDKLVLAAPTYDASLFPCMEDFLYHLKVKNYQNRTIGIMENGSWAPAAGRLMKAYADGFKNCTVVEPLVSIRSTMKESTVKDMEAMVDALLSK
ncbi:MAG: FprA family A-type flavoprotein [Clostridiales bacterium]|nr:FprA family A-type flavoprotein [Clostridiales bacterium]